MENCLAISKKNYVALKRSHYPFLSRILFCVTYPSRFRLRLMIAPPSVTRTSRGCVAADVALDTGRRCRHVWAGGRKRVRALPSLSSVPPPAIPPPTGSTVNRLYIMTEALSGLGWARWEPGGEVSRPAHPCKPLVLCPLYSPAARCALELRGWHRPHLEKAGHVVT